MAKLSSKWKRCSVLKFVGDNAEAEDSAKWIKTQGVGKLSEPAHKPAGPGGGQFTSGGAPGGRTTLNDLGDASTAPGGRSSISSKLSNETTVHPPHSAQQEKADQLAGKPGVAGQILAHAGRAGRAIKATAQAAFNKLEARYGRPQAVAIFAAGHVVGLATPLALVPGSTLLGMVPFAAMAEVYLQAKRGLGAVAGKHAEELTPEQIREKGRELLRSLKEEWGVLHGEAVMHFAEDKEGHEHDAKGLFTSKGGSADAPHKEAAKKLQRLQDLDRVQMHNITHGQIKSELGAFESLTFPQIMDAITEVYGADRAKALKQASKGQKGKIISELTRRIGEQKEAVDFNWKITEETAKAGVPLVPKLQSALATPPPQPENPKHESRSIKDDLHHALQGEVKKVSYNGEIHEATTLPNGQMLLKSASGDYVVIKPNPQAEPRKPLTSTDQATIRQKISDAIYDDQSGTKRMPTLTDLAKKPIADEGAVTKSIASAVQKVSAGRDRYNTPSMGEVYDEAVKANPGLSVEDFHAGLAKLKQKGEIGLETHTRAIGDLERPEFALPAEGEVFNFIRK
jgi:hypothetical protein